MGLVPWETLEPIPRWAALGADELFKTHLKFLLQMGSQIREEGGGLATSCCITSTASSVDAVQ